MDKYSQNKTLTLKQAGRLALATIIITFGVLAVGCDVGLLSEDEHINRAKDYQEAREWQFAFIELKNALKQNPKNPEARWLLGQMYLELKQGEAAESELLKARALGIGEEALAVYFGQALLLQGKFTQVLTEVTPSNISSPGDKAAIFQIVGDAKLGLGDFDGGCELYPKSINFSANHIPAYWGLVKCAFWKSDLDEARKTIDSALKIDSANAGTWLLLGEFEHANENFKAAEEAYSAALKRDPGNIRALNNRALLAIHAGNMAAAKIDIEKLKQLPGGVLSAQFAEAWLLYREGERAEALTLVVEVLFARPGYPPAMLLYGVLLHEKKSYSHAIQVLTQYLRKVPGDLDARKLLAAIHIQINDPDTALVLLKPFIDSGQADEQTLTLVGKAYLVKDEPSYAGEVFEKAIELIPTNTALYTQLGLSQLAAGRASEAVETLRASSEMSAKAYPADISLAYYYLSKQQFNEALAVIDVLEKKLPDNPGTHNLRGVAYQGKGDLELARKSFEKALELDPNLTSAAVRLARLYLAENNIPAARDHYENILKNDSSSVSAMVGLAELAALEKDGNQYLDWLKKAAKANPMAIVPRVMMVNYYLGKQEHRKAISAAREAVEDMPNAIEAQALLGKAQLETGEFANAVSSFSKVVEAIPKSADANFNLAMAYAGMGSRQEARLALRQVLLIDPEYHKARIALAALDRRIGERDEALNFSFELQKHALDSPAGFILEGDTWVSFKSWQQAIEAFKHALEMRKDRAVLIKLHSAMIRSGETTKADNIVLEWLHMTPTDNGVRMYLANSYLKRQLTKKAVGQYETVLGVAPENIMALNNLAILYRQLEDPRALQTAKKAYALKPGDPNLADTLGWMLVQAGESVEAMELLEKAATDKPSDPEIGFHLAYALSETGQKMRAREKLEQLRKNKLTPELERDVLALLATLP